MSASLAAAAQTVPGARGAHMLVILLRDAIVLAGMVEAATAIEDWNDALTYCG